jgi:O-antigen ligase
MFRKFYILALALISFSYPITSVFLLQLGIDSSIANMFIKILIAGLFAASLMTTYPYERNIFSVSLPILLFFFIYSFRFLYDTLALGIFTGSQGIFYNYSYFFILTFVPMIILSLALRPEDTSAIHRSIFGMVIVANLALFYHVVSGGVLSAEEAFGGRLQVDGEQAGTALLNPIVVGFMGTVLATFTIGRLAVFHNMSWKSELLHIGLIMLGTLNVMFGGSRGPVFAYVLCLLVVLAASIRSGTSTQGFKLRGRIWGYAGILVGIMIALALSDAISFSIFDRFEYMFDARTGRVEEERDFVWALAWEGFISSPIIGTSYAVWNGAGFVSAHNIILDALNATGLLGGIFLAWALVRTAIGIARLTNGSMGPHGFSLALTGVCFVTLSLTSGSISQNPDLWIYITMISLLGALGYKKSSELTARHDEASDVFRRF